MEVMSYIPGRQPYWSRELQYGYGVEYDESDDLSDTECAVTVGGQRSADCSLVERNMWGETPLHVAVAESSGDMWAISYMFYYKPIAKYMRDTNDMGLSPLHLAVQCGDVEAARTLMDFCDTAEEIWASILQPVTPRGPEWPSVAPFLLRRSGGGAQPPAQQEQQKQQQLQRTPLSIALALMERERPRPGQRRREGLFSLDQRMLHVLLRVGHTPRATAWATRAARGCSTGLRGWSCRGRCGPSCPAGRGSRMRRTP